MKNTLEKIKAECYRLINKDLIIELDEKDVGKYSNTHFANFGKNVSLSDIIDFIEDKQKRLK